VASVNGRKWGFHGRQGREAFLCSLLTSPLWGNGVYFKGKAPKHEAAPSLPTSAMLTNKCSCTSTPPYATFPLISFFTAALTCCCSEQKIFTRPDVCWALLKFLCNVHNKEIPAARQQFSHCAATHPRSLEGTLPICLYGQQKDFTFAWVVVINK
jgi:hypothetical protein